MHFTRLIVKNVEVEHLSDSPTFVFFVPPRGEDRRTIPEKNNHTFQADEIILLDNGWVMVDPLAGPESMCFPPWRVITLEDYDYARGTDDNGL